MVPVEFPFTLPVGLMDSAGVLHREGVMRRSTVFDELDAQLDGRATAHDGWIGVLLLSRVVLNIGPFSPVTPAHIGALFASDFSHLQSLYLQINAEGKAPLHLGCPACGARLAMVEA